MSTPHRATEEQRHKVEQFGRIGIPDCAAILELADRLAALETNTDAAFTQLAARVEAIENGKPCPYIRSSDEGTSYCGLAEQGVSATVKDSLTAHPGQPRTEQQAAQAPADSLVERVQAAIGHTYPDDARAAIRVVAAWLRNGRMLHAAELLELEVDHD